MIYYYNKDEEEEEGSFNLKTTVRCQWESKCYCLVPYRRVLLFIEADRWAGMQSDANKLKRAKELFSLRGQLIKCKAAVEWTSVFQ